MSLQRINNYSVHQSADVASTSIGRDTIIWQNTVILADAVIGKNCNINCHVFIENDVIIGNHVTIKPGVQIWDGIRLADNVFIGPNATFTNDNVPRSKEYPDSLSGVIVQKGASIGANATILPGVNIGRYAMIGAGAVVTKDVPDFGLVLGNPASLVGYMTHDKKRLDLQLEDENGVVYKLDNELLIKT